MWQAWYRPYMEVKYNHSVLAPLKPVSYYFERAKTFCSALGCVG